MFLWQKFVLWIIILHMHRWKGWLPAVFGCSVCWQSNISKLKMIQGALIILGIQNEIMGILSLKAWGIFLRTFLKGVFSYNSWDDQLLWQEPVYTPMSYVYDDLNVEACTLVEIVVMMIKGMLSHLNAGAGNYWRQYFHGFLNQLYSQYDRQKRGMWATHIHNLSTIHLRLL